MAEPPSGADAAAPQEWQEGDTLEVTVGPVAHGGHCVARHHGRVLFVRHTLPGEVVSARITSITKGGRFVQADAVEVLQPDPGRVSPPCPYAGPGRCGGCDFQHVDPSVQRELKAAVVAEQFSRLAGVDLADLLGSAVECVPLPPPGAGIGWRTRVEFAVDPAGTPGLRRHRSREVVPVRDCLIAVPEIDAPAVLAQDYPGLAALDVVAATDGTVSVPVGPTGPTEGVPTVTQEVLLPGGPVSFNVSARGFWQVHPAAASTFVETVMEFLGPREGERALDLYAGVGLFAAALAAAVGRRGQVTAVEGDQEAVRQSRVNLSPWPHARMKRGQVSHMVRSMAAAHREVDIVVLDPPRVGAGQAVLRDVALLAPRAVAYVACDPAALARDTAYLRAAGFELRDLRIVDAFPMTHHVECLAHFTPVRDNGV